MPLQDPADALPHHPRRILVAGPSGSGKTTLAGRIADVLHLPHIEIDALFHGPNWTPRPSFEDNVHRFSADPAWVTEWQYGSVRPHLLQRADLLVWLDLPKAVVMTQVVRRTVMRRLQRQELWNGNIEPPLRAFFSDPDHIVRWAWKTHGSNAARVNAVAQQQSGPPVVRLRSHGDADRWLRGPLQNLSRPDPEQN